MKRIPGAPDGAVHIAGSTLYVPGLTNSGYVDGLVIDTGPDERVYEFVSADRLAITHGHADHFACGAYLRKRGATVVAARDDAALVENPDINIRGMFSWAKPGDILVSKLFKGTPCRVDALVEKWRDKRATPVKLPGHTLGHTGYLTADKVLFTGDALYLEALWARHPAPLRDRSRQVAVLARSAAQRSTSTGWYPATGRSSTARPPRRTSTSTSRRSPTSRRASSRC